MSVRLLAFFGLFALVAAACGARLTDEQRIEGIAALGGGTSQGEGVTNTGARAGTTGQTAPGSAGAPGSTTTTTPGGTVGGGATTGGGSGDQAGSGGSGFDTSNLGPTDTGVTADKIVVANIADIKGVQPGLFQSARDAATAATAFINHQGGINGRQIDLLTLDSKTDAGANRAAMLEACAKAFAVVGSMSAFDDGSAQPGEECGIPDLTAITTNPPKFRATNTYPVFPNGPDHIGLSSASYIAERFPESIKSAGILWLNQAVTRGNAQRRKVGWEAAGFEFVYEQEVQVLEADYTRFVLDMQGRGVDYVTMVSDYQNIVRLQTSMRQQNYVPTVRDWDSVAYDPGYISLGQEAVEGSFVFLNNNLFEEASAIPEMQLYLEWLNRAVPGASPTYFGLYAWSAFRLFQELALGIDPNELTRDRLFAAVQQVREWDGHGIHAPHDVGGKIPSTCNLYVQVSDGAFERMHPGSGFDCSGELYALPASVQ